MDTEPRGWWLLLLRLMLSVMLCVVFTGVTGTSNNNNNNYDPNQRQQQQPPQPHPPRYAPNHPPQAESYQHQNHQPQGTNYHGQKDFAAAFRRFLRAHNYTGGSVAALKDGRLVLAQGHGVTREGTEVRAGARSALSALSQSLTAVAILRLVQQGLLGLQDPVFGARGVLREIQPLDPRAAVDPRMYDITVGHLLRHSAGWDATQAPLYDPVLNEVYQAKGHISVPSLAQLTDQPSGTPLQPLALLRYALSRPLHFTPGTRSVTSNLGYLALGRVVEEVTGMEYQDYVKRFILTPCGMWHTRIGQPGSQSLGHKLDEDVPLEDTPREERKLDNALDLFDVLDPADVDSALGWFSTVFDMARFARCVFDGDEVLNDASLEILLQRQDTVLAVADSESWLCAGFRTNTRGAVWQDGDPHAHDAILFHSLMGERHRQKAPMPDTWVVLLHGSHLHHLRHQTRELMKELGEEVLGDQSARDHFANDLSDMNTAVVDDSVLVKFQVDEHHLDAYVSAVKQEGYNVQWLSPYTTHGHTYFIVISRRIVSTTEPEVDFKVEHGLAEKQLLARKLHMERHGYNLTFLQSYSSMSHQEPYTFLAVFRKHAYSSDTQLKYGTDHLPEPYDKLVQMYQEKQFHPLVQSVLPRDNGKEEHLSFVFLQTPHSRPVDFKNHYRLSDSKLEKTVVLNADQGRTLSFLDAYDLQGRPRFAAVFTNQTRPRWHFQGGLSRAQTALLVESRLAEGLWPAMLVAYTDREQPGRVKYAAFLKSDEDVQVVSRGQQRSLRSEDEPRPDPDNPEGGQVHGSA